MPQLTTTQCGDILTYLFVEGIKNSAVAARSGSNDLQQDLFNFLQNNGYTLPIPASRQKDILGPNSSKQSIGRDYNPDNWGPNQAGKAQTRPVDLAAADAVAQRMGFADLQEMDNYTRNIKVSGKATVGTSSGSKVNLAGDKLPCRNLGTEFYDHNGVMSTNILAIASTGSLDPGFLASAKKVAAGTNYATEFPVSRGKTYILGDNLVHQMSSGTPAPTPAPAPTPTPAPAPTPAPEVTPEEVTEEVVEETPSEPVDLSDMATPQGPESSVCATFNEVENPDRQLSPTAWEERQNTSAGEYPYPLSESNPIWIHLKKAVSDPSIVLPDFTIDPSNMEADGSPWFTHGDGWICITDTSITYYDSSEIQKCRDGASTIKATQVMDIDGANSAFYVASLQFPDPATNSNPLSVEQLIVAEDGGPVIEYRNGQVFIDGFTGLTHADIWSTVGEGDLPTQMIVIDNTGWDGAFLTSVDASEYAGQVSEYIENNPPKGGLYYFDASQVDIHVNLEAYTQDVTDSAGVVIPAGDLLTRVAAKADEAFDRSTQYLKIFVRFDTPTSVTSDLYSGLDASDPDGPTGETLIISGDNFDLDLITDTGAPVYETLNVGSRIDQRNSALKSITTAKSTPATDSEGNDMGFSILPSDSFGAVKLNYEHDGDSATVSIPDTDGLIKGFDRNGDEVVGRVDEIQVHQGTAAGAWNKQKEYRRQNRMSTDFNLPNPSDTTSGSATKAVAFSRGRKFYVVGRHKGKPVMIELDLSYGE